MIDLQRSERKVVKVESEIDFTTKGNRGTTEQLIVMRSGISSREVSVDRYLY